MNAFKFRAALLGAAMISAAVPSMALANFGPTMFDGAIEAVTKSGIAVYGNGDPKGATVGVFGSGSTGVRGYGEYTGVSGETSTGAAIHGEALNSGIAVRADSFNGIGVSAYGNTAVKAVASDFNGMAIEATGGDLAIKATSTTAASGIAIDAAGYTAVRAMAPNVNTPNLKPGSVGVKASADTGVDASGKTYGVRAYSSDGTGVSASGKSRGVMAYADSTGSQGLYAFGDAEGVRADGKIGGNFSGSMAPIRLQPAATAGAPTTGAHKRGEMVVDSQGSLFLCTADGTPGTWRKVVLQ